MSEWLTETVEMCLQRATDYEREARRLRELARKMQDPPEGVTVEPGIGRYAVRFVGPPGSLDSDVLSGVF